MGGSHLHGKLLVLAELLEGRCFSVALRRHIQTIVVLVSVVGSYELGHGLVERVVDVE